jgi:hypothetical protein
MINRVRSKRLVQLAVVLPVLALLAVLAGPRLVAAAARPSAGPKLLLPDLDAVTPQGLLVKKVEVGKKPHFRLGFISAAVNVGDGPIVLRSHRAAVGQPMIASQVIERSDGTEVVRHGVGTLRYVVDPTHQHWHYLRFMVYELRSADGYRLVRPDRKTGFCLGDRYRAPEHRTLPAAPPRKVFTGDCGGRQPEILDLEEGISVGFGDVYTQIREGQDIDVTGLPAGRYYLVHRVNAKRALRESNYANNASSLLIDLSWPRGHTHAPRFAVLAACTDTARCKKGYFYDKIP